MVKIEKGLNSSVENKQCLQFINELQWQKIGFFGGRKLVHAKYSGTLCLNDIVKTLTLNSENFSDKELVALITQVKAMDKTGDQLLAESFSYQKKFTSIRRFFGNFNYNRNTQLEYLTSIANRQNADANLDPVAFIQKLNIPLPNLAATPKVQVVTPKALPEVEPVEVETVDPQTIQELKEYCKSNPLIHGTSSVIFALLPETEQSLVSVWDLLKIKRAPIGGEVFIGGLDLSITEGNSCFGRLKARKYSLLDIERRYAIKPNDLDIKNNDETKEQLRSELLAAFKYLHLTQTLLLAIRAKQRGIELFADNDKAMFSELFFAMKQYFENKYLLPLFIGRYIRDKFNNEKSFEKDTKLCDFLDSLDQFLFSEKISLKNYMDASVLPENDEMQKLRKFLEKHGFQLLNEKAEAQKAERHTGFECDYEDIFREASNPKKLCKYALKKPEELLESMADETVTAEYNSYLEKANQHFELLEEVLLKNPPSMTFNDEQQKIIDDAFPIILISNQTDAFFPNKDEYRAKHSLQLGKEIQWIATPKERIKDVEAYLKKHNISGVKVISIETLKKHTEYN